MYEGLACTRFCVLNGPRLRLSGGLSPRDRVSEGLLRAFIGVVTAAKFVAGCRAVNGLDSDALVSKRVRYVCV
jgi:hypothetical protein